MSLFDLIVFCKKTLQGIKWTPKTGQSVKIESKSNGARCKRNRFSKEFKTKVALKRAFRLHGKPEILNTDHEFPPRGFLAQFTGAAFTGILTGQKIQISSDGKGRAMDNRRQVIRCRSQGTAMA